MHPGADDNHAFQFRARDEGYGQHSDVCELVEEEQMYWSPDINRTIDQCRAGLIIKMETYKGMVRVRNTWK